MNIALHAWRSVIGNAKRTGLAIAPLALLVVIALVGVIGAHEGVGAFAQRVDDRGGAVIVVSAQPRNVSVSDDAVIATLVELADALAVSLPDVPATLITQRTSPLLSLGPADDRIDSFEIEASLMAVDARLDPALDLDLSAGRLLSEDDISARRNVALLGANLAARYGITGLEAGPVQLLLDGAPIHVVGVVAPSSRRPAIDSSVMIPRTATVLDALDGGGVASTGRSSTTLLVGSSVHRLANDERVTSALTQLFSHRNIDVNVDYQANALRDFESGSESLVSTINVLLLVAAVGAALAAFQLQSSAAKLRHRELGTRLAMGYSPTSIRRMLLLEGLFVGGVVIIATAPFAVAAASVGATSVGKLAVTYVAALTIAAALSLGLPQVATYRALRNQPYDLLTKA